jgi:hypothetical protein
MEAVFLKQKVPLLRLTGNKAIDFDALLKVLVDLKAG